MLFFILCTLILTVFAQKNPHFIDRRNAIVHLFEWKFSDIAEECENFLQYHDYGGVQVSPVSENVVLESRPWYERYQPISYKVISRSGNEDDFRLMTKKCNNVGIRIYVDVVLNHMTLNTTKAIGVAGSTAIPNNCDFPAVPYNQSDFHQRCISKGDPATIRDCQLVGLLDLNQSSSSVRNKMVDFLNKLISLGVAGFRIDAAKYMWPKDLQKIYSGTEDLLNSEFPANCRPFIYQEVSDLGKEPISKFEYTPIGVVTEFNASVSLGKIFRGMDNRKLSELKDYGAKWGFVKSSDALVFVDNHHNQRTSGSGGSNTLTYKDRKLYVMANAFLLAHPYGYARIMSSYHFEGASQGPPRYKNGTILSPKIKNGVCKNGWVCEHRWSQIYNMVAFRKFVDGTPINNWWSNGDQQIAFGRGSKGFVAFTNSGNIERKLETKMAAGVYCDIISGTLRNGACTGKSVDVDDKGIAFIELLATENEGVIAIQSNIKRSSILVNEETE